MLYKQKHIFVLCLVLLCCLTMGCAQAEPVPSAPAELAFSFGSVAADTETLTAVLTGEDVPLLDQLPALREADFSGSPCLDALAAWGAAHPEVALRYTVELPGGLTADNAAAALDLSGLTPERAREALPLLVYLPELERVQLGSDAALIRDALAAWPEIAWEYAVPLLGEALSPDIRSLDLSAAGHGEAEELLRWLPLLPALESVQLGSDEAEDPFLWEDIAAMEAACPQAEFSFDFTLFGKSFSLSDEEMDLNHIRMDDEGALVAQAAVCMPHLRRLDMDSCGVSDEAMAALRDSLPDAEVIWRVWFGENYSVRTDVERILASNPGVGGELTVENTVSLKYCTKVKYLDLGHTPTLSSIDFVSYMPELEVLILAISGWTDARPLANCSKLEYAELQNTGLNDLRPLSGLKNLRHLNIAYCFAVHDISALYELALDRLWIGCMIDIPSEQIEHFQELHPGCEVNTTVVNPTDGTWRNGVGSRYSSRYELLRQQFLYDANNAAYSFSWNDPLY